jgi:hypothetical protein
VTVPEPTAINLLQPYPKCTALEGVHSRRSRDRIRWIDWRGLPRTVLADTLVDLAIELDEEELEVGIRCTDRCVGG